MICDILSDLIFWADKDALDRYRKFIEIGGRGSQKTIFNLIENSYPDSAKFVVLPMDMAFMGAGVVKENYENKLFELYKLSCEDDSVIPFIMIDSRRPNIFDLFIKSIDMWNLKVLKYIQILAIFLIMII